MFGSLICVRNNMTAHGLLELPDLFAEPLILQESSLEISLHGSSIWHGKLT
jgi:hypothetical protein